ncbi:MAG: adenylate/guanylate cyclase domain-containing protein [Candidatus Xenobiia bacterium LiM19]
MNEFELPSFAVAVVEKFTGAKFTCNQGRKVVMRDEIPIPVDNDGRLWINYRRPVVPEKDKDIFYSFEDVLKEAEEGRDDYFKRNFKDRIALIGFTTQNQDVFKTPFSSMNLKSNIRKNVEKGEEVKYEYMMPGVEIHGHLISTILDNRYLIVAIWPANLSIVLLISLLTGCITYRARPYRALALCILLGVLYYAVVFACFTCFNIWIYFLTPIMALVCTFSAVYLYKFITEEQERQRIRKLMGRYVSTNVMEALLSNPSQLALGGTRKKVTILFSDINNFTPTSEKLTPEELMRCLNSYFDEMNAIILKYNGTIKQFVGDEIMVMYGAPLEQHDQALRAVNTALEMVDKLNELKSRNLSGAPGFFEVKIGIHTGEVVVGNVGSHDRTEYAAVGDNVNLTSRIEGLNKKLGTTVLISEDTWREVKESLVNAEFRSFEPQEVKGKTQRLTVYEVRRPERGGPNE